MSTRYIVTLCFTDRTTIREYADLAGVQEALDQKFFNGEVLSFVVTKRDSPWRKNQYEEEE